MQKSMSLKYEPSSEPLPPFPTHATSKTRPETNSETQDPYQSTLNPEIETRMVLARQVGSWQPIRIRVLRTRVFRGWKISSFSGRLAPITQFVQLSEPDKLDSCLEFSIKRRPSPKMPKSTFSLLTSQDVADTQHIYPYIYIYISIYISISIYL